MALRGSSRLSRLLCAFLLVGLFFAARPSPAHAQWAAMLPLVIESVRQAVDVWERNTRIFEDIVDHGGGLVNAFSPLNTVYSALRTSPALSHLGLGPNPSRVGDLFRATLGEPECYLAGPTFIGSRACSVHAILTATDLRDAEWLQPLLGILVGHRPFSDYEIALDGPIVPGGPAWEGRPPVLPADPLAVQLGLLTDYDNEALAAQQAYHRGRETARRLMAVKDYGRRAAQQVLIDPRRSGAVGDAFPGCPGGTPTTLLGQAVDADCRRPLPGVPPDPSGGPGGHEHLSEAEMLALNVQTAIIETTLLAAQLEEMAIRQEAFLSHRVVAEDLRRERFQDFQRALTFVTGGGPANCRTFAWAAECAAGIVSTLTAAQQQVNADYFAANY